MNKPIATLLLMLVTVVTCFAQNDPEPKKKFDKSKLFVGGNFGLNFGDVTLVNVSPQLGYRFNQYIAAGVGINGQYTQFRYRDGNGDTYQRNNYGVAGLNVFGRAYPIEQILLQLQPEINYTWGKVKRYNPIVETYTLNGKLVPALLAGGGAVIPAGRSALVAMVQIDLLGNDDRSPYGNKPFYSFGFNVGF